MKREKCRTHPEWVQKAVEVLLKGNFVVVGFMVKVALKCWVYQFPITAVTNYHKFCSLKLTQIYYLMVHKFKNGSHWAKIKISAGPNSSWKLQKRIHFLPFSRWQSCLESLIDGPLPLQSQQEAVSSSQGLTQTLDSLVSSFHI